MNHREVIRMRRHMVEPIGDPQAALPVLLPGAFALEDRRFGLAHRRDRSLEARGQRLAGEFVQQRLVIKGIEMARAAFHEEEDDALCLRRTMRDTQRRGAGLLLAHQRSQSDRAKAAAGRLQEVATRRGMIVTMAAHDGGGFKRGTKALFLTYRPLLAVF